MRRPRLGGLELGGEPQQGALVVGLACQLDRQWEAVGAESRRHGCRRLADHVPWAEVRDQTPRAVECPQGALAGKLPDSQWWPNRTGRQNDVGHLEDSIHRSRDLRLVAKAAFDSTGGDQTAELGDRPGLFRQKLRVLERGDTRCNTGQVPSEYSVRGVAREPQFLVDNGMAELLKGLDRALDRSALFGTEAGSHRVLGERLPGDSDAECFVLLLGQFDKGSVGRFDGDHIEEQRSVGDRSGDRPIDGESIPVGRSVPHPVAMWLQTEYPGEARGGANRTEAVGADRHAAQSSSDRHPRPPLEPPGPQSRSHGLRVGPQVGGSVNGHAASSEQLVNPMMIAPAERNRCTIGSSGVECRVEAIDAFERGFDQLARRHLTGLDQPGLFGGPGETQVLANRTHSATWVIITSFDRRGVVRLRSPSGTGGCSLCGRGGGCRLRARRDRCRAADSWRSHRRAP